MTNNRTEQPAGLGRLALAAALAAYEGDYLEGESTGEWHLELRERLQRCYVEGQLALGAHLAAAEDYAGAIEEYLLLATDPERRPRVWREVAMLLQRVDDREAILTRIEDMRRKHPRSPAIQDIAAMALLESGRYPQALAAIREADQYADDQGGHLLDFGRFDAGGVALRLEKVNVDSAVQEIVGDAKIRVAPQGYT